MANKAYISSKQTYYDIDMGDSGVAKINLKTGLLSTVTPLISMPGNNLPLNLELVYNSGQLNDYYMGNGCKLNVMQKIQVLSNGNIEYTDAGQWTHTFAKHNDGEKDFWVDENGTGFTITIEEGNYVMHVGNGMQYVFNGGRLVQIKNKFEKTMTITYSGSKVTQVTDGIGRQAVFAYGTGGNLSSITILKPGETAVPTSGRYKIEFGYNNGNLTSFTLPGKGETTMYHSPETDENGVERYYLNTINTPYKQEFYVTHYPDKKVWRMSYYTHNDTIDQNGTVSGTQQPEKIAFAYVDEHMTQTMNKKGVTTTYMFDNDGRLYSTFEGAAQYLSGDLNFSSGEKNTVQFNATIPYSNVWLNGNEYTDWYQANTTLWTISNVSQYRNKMMMLSAFAEVKQPVVDGKLALTLQMTTSNGVQNFDNWFETNYTNYQPGAIAIYVPNDCTNIKILAKITGGVKARFSKMRFNVTNASASQAMLYIRDETSSYTVAKAKSQMLAIKHEKDDVWVQNSIGDFYLSDLQKLLSQATYPKILYCKNATEVITDVTSAKIVLTDNTELEIPASTFKDDKKISGPELGSMSFSQQGVFYTRTKEYDADKITNVVQSSYVVETSSSPTFASNVTVAEYNQLGKPTKSTDSRGIVIENEYDDHGNVRATKTYHQDNPTVYFAQGARYTDDGDRIFVHDHEVGNATEYRYDDFGFTSEVYVPETSTGDTPPNIYDYITDHKTFLPKCTCHVDPSDHMLHERVGVQYDYNLGLLTTIKGNGRQYDLAYDGEGGIKSVNIDGRPHVTTVMDYGTEIDLSTTTYANGYVSKTTFDKYGRVTKTQDGNVVKTQNTYDVNSKKLLTHIDNYTGTNVNYTYDDYGDVSQIAEGTSAGNNVVVSVTKDADRKVSSNVATLGAGCGNVTLSNHYVYDDNKLDPRLTQEVIRDATPLLTINYTQDTFGRVDSKEYTARYGYLWKEQNTYRKWNNNTRLTHRLLSTSYTGNVAETLTYNYHTNGNITSIDSLYNGSVKTIGYTYDTLGRLVKETNHPFSAKYEYTYDKNGNRLTKKTSSFSNTDVTTTTYTYDPVIKDRLIAVGNQTIAYDAIGNPTSYLGNALTWTRGRLLNSFGNNSYTYNSAGIRTSKTVGGVTTNYALSGTDVLSQTTNGETTLFFHSAEGVIGFRKGNNDYFYCKNAQGDVFAIVNSPGFTVARYKYDAWGNHVAYYWNGEDFVVATPGNTNDNCQIALFNPYRYRSYYYDNETGLYYLQSRYYDPTTGRFLNPDTVDYLDPQSITGINLYAYCENNPVMYSDPTGHFLGFVIKVVAGAIVGAIVGAATALANGDDVATAAIIGGVSGAVSAALGDFVSVLSKAELISSFAAASFNVVSSFSIGAMANVASQKYLQGKNPNNYNARDAYIAGGLNVLFSGIQKRIDMKIEERKIATFAEEFQKNISKLFVGTASSWLENSLTSNRN